VCHTGGIPGLADNDNWSRPESRCTACSDRAVGDRHSVGQRVEKPVPHDPAFAEPISIQPSESGSPRNQDYMALSNKNWTFDIRLR
jgi:hypothetical protein